jgi:hypothetical protein
MLEDTELSEQVKLGAYSTLCAAFRRRRRVAIGFAAIGLQNVVARCMGNSLTFCHPDMGTEVSHVMTQQAGVYPHADQCEPNVPAAGGE